ncbi:HLA class II histocompatibility antigen, DM alpha chain isoform X2 [Rhinatrema bivittatum]|uniref:HLA class II histocompatibility antigen, DM alpha chain isoform X2 n=1 Tax=Rhinatrema bivittatum TaxID=194408 RepID=UPI0011265153|nr:HLA class II histocompatibility antigen, DM alpha chain isoform X2 [Rhinatrema bivittatum]
MGVGTVSCCGCLALVFLLQLLQEGAGQAGPEVAHTFSQVLYCQPGHPRVGLVDTFEDEEMYHYDFQSGSGVARLPGFQRWAGQAYDPSQISQDADMCQKFLEAISSSLESIMPEAKGIPWVRVFTKTPLQLGRPNTLICLVSNFLPPTLNITWRKHGELVSSGVSTTPASPTQDLGFHMFSYLNFTPASGDIYSCNVAQEAEQYTTVAYWVPRNPIPSDLMETVLCAVAFGLGVAFLIVGIVLIVKARRPQSTGI